jgi:hypothetical protein
MASGPPGRGRAWAKPFILHVFHRGTRASVRSRSTGLGRNGRDQMNARVYLGALG